MTFMPSFSKNDLVLIRYPFSEMTGSKVRPAVILSNPHISDEYLVAPLTSKTTKLRDGEFVLANWSSAGLNVPSAVKRGIYTVHSSLLLKQVGHLSTRD
ncbi:MAG: type II toxin-antitoxin system PemK/MazF family toxin, partial [Thermoguttaceae bacterium]